MSVAILLLRTGSVSNVNMLTKRKRYDPAPDALIIKQHSHKKQIMYTRYLIRPGFISSAPFQDTAQKAWTGDPIASILRSQSVISGHARVPKTLGGMPERTMNTLYQLLRLYSVPPPTPAPRRVHPILEPPVQLVRSVSQGDVRQPATPKPIPGRPLVEVTFEGPCKIIRVTGSDRRSFAARRREQFQQCPSPKQSVVPANSPIQSSTVEPVGVMSRTESRALTTRRIDMLQRGLNALPLQLLELHRVQDSPGGPTRRAPRLPTRQYRYRNRSLGPPSEVLDDDHKPWWAAHLPYARDTDMAEEDEDEEDTDEE